MKTQPAIKVYHNRGFSICRDAYEFANAICPFGNKTDRAAARRLWPMLLGVNLESTTWPPSQSEESANEVQS